MAAKKKAAAKKAAPRKRRRRVRKVDDPSSLRPRLVERSKLKPHPRNYRSHPEDQIKHLAASIERNGLYHPIVVARDLTVLVGHGVLRGAEMLGLEKVPVVVLDVDPESPEAIKVLTGDNEMRQLAEIDDRLLADLLKEVRELDPDELLGTGFDDAMLTNLVLVTRAEIDSVDHAAEWVGMPGFTSMQKPFRLMIQFPDQEHRETYVKKHKLKLARGREGALIWSAWWPATAFRDTKNVEYVADGEQE